MQIKATSYLLLALATAFVCRASDSTPELIGGRVADVRFAIYETKFPVRLRELREKLGGKETLEWHGGFSSGKGKPRHFETFAIRGVGTKEGVYQLEVEMADVAKDPDEDLVVGARVCFVSEKGRFYAEDLRDILGPPSWERKERKAGEPGATDNLDSASRF